MNAIERVARRVDRAQQGFGPAAFVFGVVKKFGDDRGGSLAALMTYYGFISLFPLLLILVTILGIVAGSSSSFTKSVEQSALAQFPIIGEKIGTQISVLHRNSALGLVLGILGLIYGGQGAMQAGLLAMAEVWNVPGVARPNYWVRTVRALLMMVVLGIFLLATTGAAAFVSYGHRSLLLRVGAVAATAVLNVLLYVLAFRILTPKTIGNRVLLPGAVGGGLAWTALQYAGSLLVTHQLRNVTPVYGFFGTVLGLLAWIYLGAQITVYAAESNVVKARHLWPRALVQPPLTEADERVLAAVAKQQERRPEQQVTVRFRREGEAADEEGEDGDEGPGDEAARSEGAPPGDGTSTQPAPGTAPADGGSARPKGPGGVTR